MTAKDVPKKTLEPCFYEVYRDDLNAVARRLVEDPSIVTSRDASGRTLLHLANSAEMIHLLARAGANVNARDRLAMTPLVHFVAAPTVLTAKMVEALFECGSGCDITLCDNCEQTALHWIAMMGGTKPHHALAVFRVLCARVEAPLIERLSSSRNFYGETPLHVLGMRASSLWRRNRASVKVAETLVEMLIKAGGGETALHQRDNTERTPWQVARWRNTLPPRIIRQLNTMVDSDEDNNNAIVVSDGDYDDYMND